MSDSVESRVMGIIIGHGRGWCFTSKNFMEIGSEASVRKALSSLEKKQRLVRLTQGVYEYPKIHKRLGVVPPNILSVAKAIAEKNGVQIQPAGALAANIVGLSEQVPGKVVYLTEGPSKTVKIGNQVIIFKRAAKKVMIPAGTREGTLIEALKEIGKDHIDENTSKQIRIFLRSSSEEEVKDRLKFAPTWIRSAVYDALEISV